MLKKEALQHPNRYGKTSYFSPSQTTTNLYKNTIRHSVKKHSSELFLHLQHIRKRLDRRACLTEVTHLLVDTQFDMRDSCVVQSDL